MGKSTSEGTTEFEFVFDCELLEGTVEVGDPIIYRFMIIDQNTGDTLKRLPSSGGFINTQVRYPINPSSKYTIGLDVELNQVVESSKDVIVIVETYLKNDANPIIDTDSTNNISSATSRWLSESDAASVEDFVEFSPLVYPNPAQDVIHVQLPTSEPANIELLDVKGNVVLSSMESAFNQRSIDVSTLPNGVYVLSIKQGQKVHRPQRIIVQH